MIDLLVGNVVANHNRIDSIVKHINKVDTRYCLMFLLITAELYVATKVIKDNQKRINELELKLEGMETKGE